MIYPGVLQYAPAGGGTALYKTVTIDHTKCGSADSSNFTVLVITTQTYLKTVANGGSVTSSSGYDIAFYSDSGLTTLLSFKRVYWSASTGACIFAVKVPTLSVSSDTAIYMRYSDSSATTDLQDATNAFDSNFKGYWTLGDGSTLDLNDATSNANTLTNVNSCTAASGINGTGAVQITAGGSGQALHPSNIASMSDFTVTMWVYSTVNGTNSTAFSADDFPASPRSGALFKTYRASASSGILEGYDGAGNGTAQNFTPVSINAWHKYTMRRTGSTLTLRIDGSNVTTMTMGSGTITLSNIYFGVHYYSGAMQEKDFTGKIGITEISNTYRSDSWDTAEYNNVNSPSTFYTIT